MPITINGTTGISGVDGSAAAPAVIGSDADTGLVFAAGQITASLNGSGANVPLVQGTAQNSTSGTSIDFTGIPSWAKRVTISLAGVSLSGTSNLLIQAGTGSSPTTSGYISTSNNYNASNSTGGVNSTAGFALNLSSLAASVTSGQMVLTNVSGNLWISSHAVKNSTTQVATGGGDVTLGGALGMIRITTINGTDTFDAGSINILWE